MMHKNKLIDRVRISSGIFIVIRTASRLPCFYPVTFVLPNTLIPYMHRIIIIYKTHLRTKRFTKHTRILIFYLAREIQRILLVSEDVNCNYYNRVDKLSRHTCTIVEYFYNHIFVVVFHYKHVFLKTYRFLIINLYTYTYGR